MYDYISSQALEWYQFLDGYQKDKRFITIPNGNLYLVTGVDKVPEWSVFSFWRTKEGKDCDPLSVNYAYDEDDPWTTDDTDDYIMEDNHCLEAEHDGRLACAFVRGIRIAVSPTAWGEFLPTKISDSIYNIPTGSLDDTALTSSDAFVRSLRKVHPELSQEV